MRSRNNTNGGLVYSTDHGAMCPGCSQPLTNCVCNRPTSAASKDGVVRVGRETKGRKGTGVMVISGLPLNPEQLNTLCSELKKQCGCGGTVKDGVIEIQGDRRDQLVSQLTKQGYVAKKVGG